MSSPYGMKDLFCRQQATPLFGYVAHNILELPDAVVYPGFTDGHQHLEGLGEEPAV